MIRLLDPNGLSPLYREWAPRRAPAAERFPTPPIEGQIDDMSHDASAHHGRSGSSTGALPFPPTEVEALHDQDKKAATAIVGLMVGIFILGVLGYLVVCWLVSS